jgi:hypothetical protein
MTWFPVTKLQVVAPEVLHTEPLWAFGGTNGCVPPQVQGNRFRLMRWSDG